MGTHPTARPASTLVYPRRQDTAQREHASLSPLGAACGRVADPQPGVWRYTLINVYTQQQMCVCVSHNHSPPRRKLESAEARKERVAQEQELAKAIAEDGDDGDF